MFVFSFIPLTVTTMTTKIQGRFPATVSIRDDIAFIDAPAVTNQGITTAATVALAPASAVSQLLTLVATADSYTAVYDDDAPEQGSAWTFRHGATISRLYAPTPC